MTRKRKTVPVSDLAYFAAHPDNFVYYKTNKNSQAINRGLAAHGVGYKTKKSSFIKYWIYLIVVLSLGFILWSVML
jgi:hypothetical protein